MKPVIKTFIIEEHNEAYIIWHKAILGEFMKPTGNCLLHFDEHSDMNVPHFRSTLKGMGATLEEIRAFTNKEIGIANFIMPAAFQGFFDEIYWIKKKHRKRSQREFELFVAATDSHTTQFIAGELTDIEVVPENAKTFKYSKIEADGVKGDFDQSVLDIDLDYFSCAGNPNQNRKFKIEITESEFEKFKDNFYHPLRFLEVGNINAINDGNQFFYVFNDQTDRPGNLNVVGEDVIEKLVEILVAQLKDTKIVPQVITICRSRFSGYTPDSQWRFIESKLLEGLSSIYDLDLFYNEHPLSVSLA